MPSDGLGALHHAKDTAPQIVKCTRFQIEDDVWKPTQTRHSATRSTQLDTNGNSQCYVLDEFSSGDVAGTGGMGDLSLHVIDTASFGDKSRKELLTGNRFQDTPAAASTPLEQSSVHCTFPDSPPHLDAECVSPLPPDIGGREATSIDATQPVSGSAKQSAPNVRKGLRMFKSSAQCVLAVARIGLLADDGIPLSENEIALVQRIAVTLASSNSFMVLSERVFQKFGVNVHNDKGIQEKMLPAENFVCVLDHWGIPHGHLQLFEALLRRQESHWDSPSIAYVNLRDFQDALAKFLRRVRNIHAASRVAKSYFVRRNDRKIEDVYMLGDACGSGAFGECRWVIQKKPPQRKCVCKKISLDAKVPTEEIPAELDLLTRLDHPNIVRVFEWFENDDGYHFILQAARGGDLRRLLLEAKASSSDSTVSVGIDVGLACGLIRQSLQGIAYIHSQRIVHRDIKPANMLLMEADAARPHLVLTDFGLSDVFEDERARSLVKGTASYMAPEVFDGFGGPRVDMWALGVVTFELLSGQRPIKCDNVPAMYMKLKKCAICYDSIHLISPIAEAFIKRLLVRNESERPSAVDALQDAWITHAATLWEPSKRSARLKRNNLNDHLQTSYFAKVAMTCVASQLGADELDGIDEAFVSMDINCDGELSLDELTSGLKKLGVAPESAGQLADALDVNHDGSVQYNEFVASLLRSQHELAESNLRHAFDIIDVDHNGNISLDELRLMLCGDAPLAGVLPDGRTADSVLKEVDTSHDGTISFQEFKAYLLHESYHPQEALVPADPDESIESVLRRLTLEAGHSEKVASACARKLVNDHWIETMGDLLSLDDLGWDRMELPVKLMHLLREACH